MMMFYNPVSELDETVYRRVSRQISGYGQFETIGLTPRKAFAKYARETDRLSDILWGRNPALENVTNG